MFTLPAVVPLNHLLTQSGWALQRLSRFSGKTVRFGIVPFSLVVTVQDDGTLLEAAANVSPDANFKIAPSLLPRLALQDEGAYAQVETSGDAELVAEIIFIARNLRWDAAEDLSRITGDIVAERIVQLANAGQQAVRDGVLNFSHALAEYWTEERPLLAKPQQLAAFSQEVAKLHTELEQLEQRINKLCDYSGC